MLKRDISRSNVLIAAAGGMIGSGWLFSPFISAQIAGSNALISWVIAAIFMVFIALPLCELGSMFPISGGMTNYPSFTHGNTVGFLFAWTSWLSYVVMTPIEIQAILQYSGRLFPNLLIKNSAAFELSPAGYLVAVVIMLLVVLLNSFGIRLLAQCNKYVSLIKFIIPMVTIVSFISISPDWTAIHLHLRDKASWAQIVSALSVGGIAFAFTGFQNGLMLAGEVINPQRNIPIAILGAVFIGFVLYFMLQLSFLMAVPHHYVAQGWAHLAFPGDSGPFVGLALLLGLGFVAVLLMFDAMFSPLGTTLVYTAATSRIVYGMALNNHLPAALTKLNRFKIPTWTLYINFLVGACAFLPFPGWQKMVAFLSSCSILSYGVGPICLLAMRQLQPERVRPFRLSCGVLFSHIAFYICNLMLYWCGFDVLWKLDVALLVGLSLHIFYQKKIGSFYKSLSLYWLVAYLTGLLLLSYFGSFGGIALVVFPWDLVIILPFSILVLYGSQNVLVTKSYHETVLSAVLSADDIEPSHA